MSRHELGFPRGKHCNCLQPVSWRMVVDSQVLFEHKYFIGYLSVISVGYTELKAVHTRLIYVYKKNEDDLTL